MSDTVLVPRPPSPNSEKNTKQQQQVPLFATYTRFTVAGYCRNFFGHTDANVESFGTEGTRKQHAF